MKHAKIEICPVENFDPSLASDPHYLRLVASNGLTLAVSECYSSRSKARRGARAWLDAMHDITVSVTDAVVEVQE